MGVVIYMSEPMLLNTSEIISGAKANIDKAIGDVRAILQAKEAHWSCFVLCLCIIDYLAGYRYTGIEQKIRGRYKRYIREYLHNINEEYDDEKMYNLRCGMVHGFTGMHKGKSEHLFTHLYPFAHLTKTESDLGARVLMDVNTLLNDIEKSSEKMFEEAKTSPIIIASMILRNQEVGFIRSDIKHKLRQEEEEKDDE
jgi:hypothetical protein